MFHTKSVERIPWVCIINTIPHPLRNNLLLAYKHRATRVLCVTCIHYFCDGVNVGKEDAVATDRNYMNSSVAKVRVAANLGNVTANEKDIMSLRMSHICTEQNVILRLTNKVPSWPCDFPLDGVDRCKIHHNGVCTYPARCH